MVDICITSLVIDIHNEKKKKLKHYYIETIFNTITLREGKYKNYNERDKI